MSDDNRKEQPGEMSPEFRVWAESIPKASMLCSDPAHRLRWSWKCSLCGVTGPRTLEAMNDHLLSCEKRPQSAEDALANALEDAVRTLGAAREMLGVFEDNGGHDGLGGKGYVATIDQIDNALATARTALRAAGRLP